MKLDTLDHALIQALREDGTTPLRKLAQRCLSSEATVRRRIARLRKNDVVRIVGVANPFKQGYPVVAILNLKIDQRRIHAIKNALAKMEELRFAGVTLGAFDMVAEAWFRSPQEMLAFTTETLAQVPGVIRVEPLQIHEMVIYTYDWGKSREKPRRRRKRRLESEVRKRVSA